MLKINKILSKKMKYSLSLRGLFFFCHSRESGNPSSPSLRGAKRRGNLSGFSLIELMVAVVILAMAIFGIFQAYSVGFMGMADARDRTVATNYIQETIEDYKNMDFNQVKSKPITLIPNTKFSRGAYVLNLEVIDEVVTLKKVITQVRWIDRKGNIKTEKASTILYKKPATSVVSGAARIIIYADPYYTILPNFTDGLNIIAEIKDENGNTVYSGDITFSIITTYGEGEAPVGYIYEPLRSVTYPTDTGTESAPDGIALVKFYPFTVTEGTPVDGIERIQASAIINGDVKTDTVNIRITTGPVGIILEPATEEDRILPAGVGIVSTINITVVKADYETPIEYSNPITLGDIEHGTLSDITIPSVPTGGTSFYITSDNTPGIVEITASAPDLDMGYTEVIFTGEPDSILVAPGKKSIYPGEDIDITVSIVDVNKVPVDFDGEVILSADPDYGSFNQSSLDFGSTSLLELKSTFTAYTSAPPGETITIQANSGVLSGSTEITILSLLNPKYLELDVYPFSVDLDLVGGEHFTKITATVCDDISRETVTTYDTPITFIAKDKNGINFGVFSPINPKNPVYGIAEVILSSDDAGTVTITASSGDLILIPEEGREVVFYRTADHIELSADPLSIEADGHETSIITATVCDENGNEVVNYNDDPIYPKDITFTSTLGKFHILGGSPSPSADTNEITEDDFDGGVVIVEFYSDIPSETPAEISAVSSDFLSDNGPVSITLLGDIPSVLALGNVTNWDDYLISFGLTVTGSPLYLTKIKVEWDNSHAVLNDFKIYDQEEEVYLLEILNIGLASPYNKTIEEEVITLTIEKEYTISLHFGDVSDAQAKMKNNNLIVTFTDEDNIEYPLSFKVP